jgi:hypothetical protein
VSGRNGAWAWFRSLPGWAQLGVPFAIVVLIAYAAGGGDGDGDRSSHEARVVAQQHTTAPAESSAAEHEARRERRRARARARRRAEARREAAARRRAEARREQRAAERRRQREREREAAAAASSSESSCDSSYSGDCLDPGASDYDCAGGSGDGPEYAQGPIQVVGDDHFDLDRDGDGTACE